jgi:hypothetical protein
MKRRSFWVGVPPGHSRPHLPIRARGRGTERRARTTRGRPVSTHITARMRSGRSTHGTPVIGGRGTISGNSNRSGSSNVLPRLSGRASSRRRRLSSGTKRAASNGFRLMRQVTARRHRWVRPPWPTPPHAGSARPRQLAGRRVAARGVSAKYAEGGRPQTSVSRPPSPRGREWAITATPGTWPESAPNPARAKHG